MNLGVDFFGSDAIDHRLVEWVVEWDRGDDGGAPGGEIAVIGRKLCFFDAFPYEEGVTGVQRMIIEVVNAVPERLIPNVEGAVGFNVWKVRCVRSGQRGRGFDTVALRERKNFWDCCEAGLLGFVLNVEEDAVGSDEFEFDFFVGRALFIQRVGCRDWEKKGVRGVARGANADNLAADVFHPNSDRIDAIHRIAEAAGKNDFVRWSLLSKEGAGHDCDPLVGLNKAKLLDEARIRYVSELGEGGAMLRKRSINSGELSWVLRVGVGKTVQVCRGGGLNREVTHGEFGSGGDDGGDRHVKIESLSKNSTDCENIFSGK